MLLPGCGRSQSGASNTPASKPLPPLAIRSLDLLSPLAGLQWLVVARPREIASTSWLEASIAMLLDKGRLDQAAVSMGFDLRTVPEAIWAGYRADNNGLDDTSLQLVRHSSDSLKIEQLFRDRLSSDVSRSIDDPRVVRVGGRIGRTVHAMATIGVDIVCLQQAGSVDRGPCRVASLLALGKLKRTRSVFEDEAMHSLARRFGPAPLQLFAPGPFEGDLARGVHGLLGAATGIGMSFRPSVHESVLVEIVVTGDFTESGAEGSQRLMASWEDLAARPLGRLLGLDAPVAHAMPMRMAEMVGILVDLDAHKLAKGLADATRNQIREIMVLR